MSFQGQFWHLTNLRQTEEFCEHVRELAVQQNGLFVQTLQGKKARTAQQQRAIEVYCREVAKTLNDAGIDMQTFFKTFEFKASIPWSQSSVKENLWRNLQVPLTGKRSSTSLETHEVSEVYEAMHSRIIAELGLYVPFPSQDKV